MAEDSMIGRVEIPNSLEGMKDLLRTLMNVRPPVPISDKVLELQNNELQIQLSEKGIVPLSETEPTAMDKVRIWQGDITRLKVDAIVNAANNKLLGCFIPLHRCIDNAIHSAAGLQLRLACQEIMKAQGREERTGEAKLTSGYNLPCKYVIHTVGPIIPNGIPTDHQQRQLADCYRSCLEVATNHGITSLAFCCISTGEFHFPNELAASIAVETVTKFLKERPDSTIDNVVLNSFKTIDYEIYKKLLK